MARIGLEKFLKMANEHAHQLKIVNQIRPNRENFENFHIEFRGAHPPEREALWHKYVKALTVTQRQKARVILLSLRKADMDKANLSSFSKIIDDASSFGEKRKSK